CVRLSSCSGPSRTRAVRSQPSASEASSKVCPITGAANAPSIPTDCDPWPGNSIAYFICSLYLSGPRSFALAAFAAVEAAENQAVAERAQRTVEMRFNNDAAADCGLIRYWRSRHQLPSDLTKKI